MILISNFGIDKDKQLSVISHLRSHLNTNSFCVPRVFILFRFISSSFIMMIKLFLMDMSVRVCVCIFDSKFGCQCIVFVHFHCKFMIIKVNCVIVCLCTHRNFYRALFVAFLAHCYIVRTQRRKVSPSPIERI